MCRSLFTIAEVLRHRHDYDRPGPRHSTGQQIRPFGDLLFHPFLAGGAGEHNLDGSSEPDTVARLLGRLLFDVDAIVELLISLECRLWRHL